MSKPGRPKKNQKPTTDFKVDPNINWIERLIEIHDFQQRHDGYGSEPIGSKERGSKLYATKRDNISFRKRMRREGHPELKSIIKNSLEFDAKIDEQIKSKRGYANNPPIPIFLAIPMIGALEFVKENPEQQKAFLDLLRNERLSTSYRWPKLNGVRLRGEGAPRLIAELKKNLLKAILKNKRLSIALDCLDDVLRSDGKFDFSQLSADWEKRRGLLLYEKASGKGLDNLKSDLLLIGKAVLFLEKTTFEGYKTFSFMIPGSRYSNPPSNLQSSMQWIRQHFGASHTKS